MSRKKLLTLLSRADDVGFLQMLWATYVLQSENPVPASRYIKHPKDAATPDPASSYAVRHWELDTLATLVLTTEKAKLSHGKNHLLRTDVWDAMATVVTLLHDLEEGESGMKITSDNVLQEMSRIAQRQFHWQRSYFHAEGIRRALYVYGHEDAKAYFQEKYGVSLDGFTMTCIMLSVEFLSRPWIRESNFKQLRDNTEMFRKVLSIASRPVGGIRKEAGQLRALMTQLIGGMWRHAYLPSILRRYPLVEHRGEFIAPIPALLIYRATAGLYYDFIGEDAKSLLKTAEKRFETYIQELIPAYLPDLVTLSEILIGTKKAKFLTPDVLVRSGGTITLVIECKATKNTFAAQFAQDQIKGGKRGTDQLCKGVMQLWRFFSAVRRGIYTANPVAPEARGMVVTMDNWLLFDTFVRESILQQAIIDAAKYPEILEQDRKPIIFCSAQDFADTLQESNESGLYAAVDAASGVKYAGWDLIGILRDLGLSVEGKPFPFNMDDVVPWRRDLPN